MRAWPFALIAGLSAFALYAATASPLVGTHDVAEMQALAATGGIAHAGYPTLVLLMRLVAPLHAGTLAWRVNVLSGAMGALAVAALAYVAMRITRRGALSALAALAFACSYTMWSESAQIGVHALTLAIGSGTFLLALRFLRSPSPALALGAGAGAGLGLTCHLTAVALALPLAYIAWRLLRARALRVPHAAALVLGVLLGLSPFAYTLAHDQPQSRMNYMHDTMAPEDGPATRWGPGLAPRVSRLAWLLSGRQYFREQGYSLRALPRHVASLAASEAINEFPLPSLGVAAFGLLLLMSSSGAVAAACGAWLLGVVACTLRGGTELTAEWFFLPGAWLLGLGLAVACARASAWRPGAGVALALLMAALPLARLSQAEPPGALAHSSTVRDAWRRWPVEWSPLRHDARFDRFGRAAMAALPPDATVLARWSPACVLRYFSYGEALRPDVDVRFAPDQDGERFLRHWREAAATGRPVFVTSLPDSAALAGGRAEAFMVPEWSGLWRLQLPQPGDQRAGDLRGSSAAKPVASSHASAAK